MSSSISPFQLLCCLIVFSTLSLRIQPILILYRTYYVADLNATTSLNGFPCKPAAQVTSDDFFLQRTELQTQTSTFGATATPGDIITFPGLNTLGISMNRFDFAPGGLNSSHSHPRASESGVVNEGRLLVGFITTDNVFHFKVLTAGQMFVTPTGLGHFQLNVGEGKALTFTAFSSHLPGAVVVPSRK